MIHESISYLTDAIIILLQCFLFSKIKIIQKSVVLNNSTDKSSRIEAPMSVENVTAQNLFLGALESANIKENFKQSQKMIEKHNPQKKE